jgi:hypothetical protein
MNQEFENTKFDRQDLAGRLEAEETLRRVAQLAPPEELEGRVHARVRHRMAEEREDAARPGLWAFWALWTPVRRLQFAGAAVLAIAVGGLTWGGYHLHGAAHPASVPTVAAPAPGGFGSAGALRVPPTLTPIEVPPAPKKKPGAASGKRAVKPSAGKTANPASQP